MTRKIYAVTGATGHVGRVVAQRLTAQGHEVRPVSRTSGISFEDLPGLTQAFSGADGVFLMIPPDFKSPDLRKHQNEIGANLAEAVKAAQVRRVVFLSSINAQLTEGTGPILGLHDTEERLDHLGIAELVHLRPAFFMENHLWGVGLVAQSGTYGTAFRPDAPLPMIATRDIGEKASELLSEEPFLQPRTRELLGPRDYTMAEATCILGAAIGKPELRYIQVPYEEVYAAMLGLGMSRSYAEASVEIARSFNDGKVQGVEKRSPQNTTPTTLEQFAQTVYREAYQAAMAGAS